MKPTIRDGRQIAALSVAGSDSGGNAGLQADVRAFHTFGLHACTVVAALTAQNPSGVSAVVVPDPAFVVAQLDAVLPAYAIGALKTGMLATREVIEAVAARLAAVPGIPKVVDPVMVATSGAKLLRDDAIDAMRARMLPLAALATPNLPEAEVLSGMAIASAADMAPPHPRGRRLRGPAQGRPPRRRARGGPPALRRGRLPVRLPRRRTPRLHPRHRLLALRRHRRLARARPRPSRRRVRGQGLRLRGDPHLASRRPRGDRPRHARRPGPPAPPGDRPPRGSAPVARGRYRPSQRAKFSRRRRPARPDFSGWNCVAARLPRPTIEAKRVPAYSVVQTASAGSAGAG